MSNIYLTRLIIETTAPMAIYSGNRDTGFDNQLARDANGLPYLPGTSIAGVWRNLVREYLDSQSDRKWFGGVDENDHSSCLSISNGIVHDSHNRPVVGLKTMAELQKDPLLALLHQDRPLHRERVRINDRGVASDQAKFDQLLIPAGVRFCVDISFDDQKLSPPDTEQWQMILACWQHRRFALGSTTRNGLGRFKVIGSLQEKVALKNNPQAAVQLAAFAALKAIPVQSTLQNPMTEQPFAILPIKALDNWRCGAGSELLGKDKKPEHTVSLITYSESRITWPNNVAKLDEKPLPVICGSSIKGILAHRIAFHLRKHLAIWAEDMSESSHKEWQTRPEQLSALLGFADDSPGAVHGNNLAGRLYVDDCEISFKDTTIRQHNSIDRFTGGVRKGALYSEELLYQPEFTIRLWLAAHTSLSPELASALQDTLNDLQLGLLPMGAGSGRGTSLVMHNPSQEWIVNLQHVTEKTEAIMESDHV
jgi:CRISPR/Cas system CSM-associated protein Csm3 (group 7 of RAMP superfamily)